MSSILTNLPQLTAATNSDWLYIVDVSDTTDNPAGSSKKILRSDLYAQITGFTYLNNTITLSLSDNSSYEVVIDTMTGLTINGVLSATTYENLPLDVFTTGGTYSDGTLTFTNNSGGTYSVSGLITGDTYWISGSTGNYSIKTNNDSGLDATGNYAVAEGYQTLASGPGSHAQGSGTIASGLISHAEGSNTISGGYASHAEGEHSIATGDHSHAEGSTTTASNTSSHSEGAGTTASGEASHAEGGSSVASGTFSHAEGSYTTASAGSSHAEGSNTTASGDYSHAEGLYSVASGESSHAEGSWTIAAGENSHAEGYGSMAGWKGFSIDSVVNGIITLNSSYGDVTGEFNSGTVILDYELYSYTTATFSSTTNTEILLDNITVNSGSYVSDLNNLNSQYADNFIGDSAHAEGGGTKALGIGSHAEGQNTTASEFASHAEGKQTIASGKFSHAEGYQTKAYGDSSHAEGQTTKAIGVNSHAEGSSSVASGDYSHTEGQGTTAGWKGFSIDSVVDGLITLNSSYGDVTSEFNIGTVILDYKLYDVNTVTFSSTTNTQILLDNITVNSGTYVSDLLNYNSNYADNLIGAGSHAEGFNTKAFGKYSHSEGNSTIALGESTHAGGSGSKAFGNYSHAEGKQTTALGESAHAEGNLTIASGEASHAEGFYTTASGVNSHAEGDNTTASGYNSHAENQNTIAIGHSSHAEGDYSVGIGEASHAEGYWTKTGWKGFRVDSISGRTIRLNSSYGDITSEFLGNRILTNSYVSKDTYGIDSVSFVSGSTEIIVSDDYIDPNFIYVADFNNLYSENADVINYGRYTHAEGQFTKALGESSHVEGRGSTAIGNHSHAEGNFTVSSGIYSHAEGNDTNTYGLGSHAEGGYTITGWKGFSIESVVNGLVKLNSYYGDVTLEFESNKVLFNNVGWMNRDEIKTYTTVTFDGVNTYIQLNDTSINNGDVIVDITRPYSGSEYRGLYTHAEGESTKAIGDSSHAEGYNTKAIGTNSHAEGEQTKTIGINSHAEGVYSQAIGDGSHAEGGYYDGIDYLSGGTAIGHASHAEGRKTISGWKGFTVDSVVDGLITINSSYGDITSEFIGNKVILDTKIYTYNTITFSSTTNTQILLNDTTVIFGGYVADIDNLNSPYGEINDNGVSSHAEGSQTKSLGYYSHAEGSNTIASGNYGSHTEGSGTLASGDYSHAEGDRTRALGDSSHTEGVLTIASGQNSHAEGGNTLAQGHYSHAEGYQTTTSGEGSHAEGGVTIAEGEYSHAEGYATLAQGHGSHAEGGYFDGVDVYSGGTTIGNASHAEGYQTIAGWKGFTVDSVVNGLITINSSYGDITSEFTGSRVILDNYLYYYNTITFSSTTNTEILLNDTSVNSGSIVADLSNLNSPYGELFDNGRNSHAEGQNTKALGIGSHSEGASTIASGLFSHTEGSDTQAIGNRSHAEGDSTIAKGQNSHSEGQGTIASGDTSHTEGWNSVSYGFASHAEGGGTSSYGVASHSEGQSTTAGGDYSHSEGYFTTASGEGSHAGGYISTASGDTSFIHSYESIVLGDRSVVLGGQGITGSTDDTVYVPYFNIQSAITDNLLTDILVLDVNGDVKTRDINTIGFTGGTVSGATIFTGGLSANTISATTYYNLPVTADTYTTGFTFNASNYDLTIKQNNGQTDLTVNLGVLSSDITITGGTYNPTTGIATFTNNTGGTFSVSGFLTGMTDTYVSGFTYSNNNLTIKQTAGQPDLTVNISTMTGLTINGDLVVTGQTTTNSLSASTITATTITADNYENLPFTDNQTVEIFISGGTEYLRVKDTVSAPSGGTRTFQGNVVINSGFTANTISAATYYNLPLDVFTTGGTYNNSTGIATFTNNSGGTFNVSGFFTGSTDNYTTGYTYNNNTFTIKRNNGLSDLTATINTMTGLTINGDLTVTGQTTTNSLSASTLTATTITATDYQNLPFTDNQTIEGFVSGSSTYVRIKEVVAAPSGGTRTFQGNVVISSGFTANTISATTYYNLPLDVFTTGGTYNNTTGIATFTNNSGGTFNVSGFFTGSTDNYTTGFTYNNNTFTIKRNNGLPDLSTTINTMTGLTVNGDVNITGQTTSGSVSATTITADTITANNYQNLPFTDNQTLEIFLSGGTEYARLKDTISAPSGGTRVFQGNVVVNSGFTANTISATTYYNLPVTADTFTTGFTFNVSNYDLTIKQNNSKPDLTVNLGILASDITITGGTYNPTTGIATFTNNTGGTFSVSGFLTGMTDTYVSGFTYSNNNLTIKQTAGQPDLTVNISTMTGLTINGDLVVSGGTQSWFSGNSSSDLVRITQTGSGNALVVEDADNPDISQFVVDNTGNVGIGTSTPISKLQISNTATTVSTALYTSDFITLTAEATAPGLNIISAGNSVGNRGVFKSTRSRGTLSTPTLPQSGDYTFSLLGAAYDGVTNFATAGISYIIDGSVTANTIPQSIIFETGTGNTRSERIRINSSGKVGIGMTPSSGSAQLTVKSAAVPSTAESIASFQVSDSSSNLTIGNGATTDNVFVPSLAFTQANGNTNWASLYQGFIYNTDDVGTNPINVFRAQTQTTGGTLSSVVVRPLFEFRNWSTSVLLIDVNGNVGIGTTSPISKLDVSGSARVNGNLTATTVSATTYYNLPVTADTYTTGFTYNNNTFTIKQNNGQSDLSVNVNTMTGLTINGDLTITGQTTTNSLSANTFSATTYYNLPLDVYTTGGTFNSITGVLTLTNNSGGTFNVSGFTTTTPTLSQVLSSGNTTSGYDIIISSGDTISNTGGTSSMYFGYGIEPNGVNLQSGNSTLKSVVVVQELNGVSFYHTHTGTTSTSSVTVHETNGIGLSAFDNTFTDQYTTIYQTGDAIIVEGDSTIGAGSTFSGIEYLVDYSSNYSNRSLVDKEYVDNLVSVSGAYLPLSGGTVSGATNFTAGLTANTFYTQYIDFNTTATTTHQEGRIHWNNDIKSLEIDTENPEVQVQVGHEMVVRVNNQTGAVLTKGTAVYINGVQGQRPTVTKADYSADTTSASVIGLVAADISDGMNGYVVTSGILEGLNTAAYSAGTSLYLFTGGTYSNNKPQAPDHDVRIGKVIVSNATTGSIYVNIQNGYELEELHDVRITSATTGDLLVRSTYSGSDVWVNTKTLTGNYNVNGTLSATTLSATTYQNLPLDVFTTGGTYNSGTGVATFTNNSGGTFSVSGFSSSSSSFTGGTVSGATNFTGGLTANTISATTYNNLPKVGFSPINVGVCDTAPTAASTQYYYQTIGEVTTTLSKVKLWGFSGSDLVIFGIYRGSLGGSMTLIGQARGTCGIGPNELTLSAETGQNLTITAGEDLVIGYYPDGTSWRTVYDVGISDILFGILNTGNITTMPATPTGTATGIRFACTLY